MGRVFVFGMLGLVVIGLGTLVVFLTPVSRWWLKKGGKK